MIGFQVMLGNGDPIANITIANRTPGADVPMYEYSITWRDMQHVTHAKTGCVTHERKRDILCLLSDVLRDALRDDATGEG